jgi:hypothetical protein
VRRFCRRHAPGRLDLDAHPAGPVARHDLGAVWLAPPVAPSGQENERYWRLAGRTSRAGRGRSYARHKLAIAAERALDLDVDDRIEPDQLTSSVLCLRIDEVGVNPLLNHGRAKGALFSRAAERE